MGTIELQLGQSSRMSSWQKGRAGAVTADWLGSAFRRVGWIGCLDLYRKGALIGT